MLEVYNLQRLKTAVLQNSFDRIETEEINAVNKFQFSIPGNDPKIAFCKHFHYVRLDDGALYRILTPRKSKEDTEIKIFDCEHVIATLTDDVLFGQHVIGNVGVYTSDVINYILSKQTVQRWVLYECDFNRQFEYAWENENLLAALFSVANRFTSPYMWVFDTSAYPWRLSLKAINPDAPPQFYIRAGRNLLSMEEEEAGVDVCTRLYCLGYGEGVNQLTISDVNGGLPYLTAPQSKIDEYGLISRIFVDRRFEDAQSLKERGQAILSELQEPRLSRAFAVADLYKLTKDDLDRAELGRIACFTEDGTKTYITAIARNHDIPGDMSLTLATKAVDVASTIADLADRQRIEQVYSQGATQIYAQSVQANATSSVVARLNFYIPEEMRIVNAVKLKINLSAFRSYSRATSGGGASTVTSSSGGGSTATSSSGGGATVTSESGGSTRVTSSSGGGTTVTSSSGGGTTVTSSSGGGTTVASTSGGGSWVTSASGGGDSSTSGWGGGTWETSEGGGSWYDTTYDAGAGWYDPAETSTVDEWVATNYPHYHTFEYRHAHEYSIPDHSHSVYIPDHYHDVYIPDHAHEVYIPDHSHSVTIPNHSHSVTIRDHSHSVTIRDHSHSIELPSHTHSVTIQSHTHSVTIPNHTHSVSIPEHTHGIEQGLFTFGHPTRAYLYVDGAYKGELQTNTETDITAYLLNGEGKINRGAWHSVDIRPNDKAYVTIDMMVQGFIQSRGGNTV